MLKKVLISVFILFIVSVFFIFKNTKNKDELVVWTIQLKPVAQSFIEKNILEFEKRHPEIKIIWVDIPIAEAQKRILASILGGNPPDLVNLNPEFSTILAQRGALEFFNISELQNYHPTLVNLLQFEEKIFAIPFYATSSLTIYNKSCLSNNFKLKTYNDILNLKTNTCTNAFAINLNENDTMSKILNKYDVYDFKDASSILKTKEVFELFNIMYKTQKTGQDMLTLNHREVVEKYMAQGAAVIVAGSNFIKMIKDNAFDVYKKSDITYQLTGSNGKYDVSLMNFVIPKRARHKKLAKEFLFLLTNRENQLEFAKLTNVLPANIYSLEDDFFKCSKSSDLTDKARCLSVKQLDNLQDKNFGFLNKKEINDTVNRSLQEYILQNKSQALYELAKSVNKLQE